MKIITPTTTVFIPDHNGVPRSPSEGPFTVTDTYAAHLKDNGTLTDDQVEEADQPEDGEAPSGDDLAGLKLADLKKIAAEEAVDIGDAHTIAEFVTVIRAHRAAQ